MLARIITAVFLFTICNLQAQIDEGPGFWHTQALEIDSIQQNTLMVFTGSDWCRNCMKLHESVLDDNAFTNALDSSIYPLLIDLPRNKKNQEEESIRDLKIHLAEKFNPQGQFPFLVLVNPDGKRIASTAYISDLPQDYLDWVYSHIQKP